MPRPKRICTAIGALAGAALLGAGAFWMTHVNIDGTFFSRKDTVYDLRDHDLTRQQYDELCMQYPDVEILWSVPFQDSRYDADTEHIKIATLTKEDADSLDLLPMLKYVEADDCKDYDALLYLQQKRPELEVLYYIPLGSGTCDSLSKTYTAQDATLQQLEEALPYLPRLQQLGLSGKLPQMEDLLKLRTEFPQVQLLCTLDLWGQPLHTDARKLDFTGVSVDPLELSRMLPLFPDVKEVILSGTALTVSQYRILTGEHPGVSFLCELEIGGNVYSTALSEIDVSGMAVSEEDVEAMIPLFPNLTKLIMSNCGIDDETMDALNQRYPHIQIVWTVMVGHVPVRTDSIIFYPAAIDQYHLPSNEQMQKLRYCRDLVAIDIGHSDATDCSWLAYTPHVKYLILADTNISDISPLANLKELVYLEVFNTDVSDYTPLLECTKLQDLNIGETYGDPEPLTQMTWLHNLQWHPVQDHPVLGPKAEALKEQLPDTNITLKTRRKNIGGPWRMLPNYYLFRELLGGGFYNQERIYNGNWDYEEGKRILACNDTELFAGDVLAEIVRHRIDSNLPIFGIKNVGSDKAERLYQTILEVQELYYK